MGRPDAAGWKSATVKTFAAENGFGRAEVDGAELVFDVDALQPGRTPSAGEKVRVQVGSGRAGPRIVALKTLEPPIDYGEMLSWKRGLGVAQEHGLAPSLTTRAAARIARELELDSDAEALDVLLMHYEACPEDAARDGQLRYDWRFGNDTDDVFADFSRRAGVPLLVQTLNDQERGVLQARTLRGEDLAFDVSLGANGGSLDGIARAADRELAAARMTKRFFSARTDSDFYAFFLLEPGRALALHRARAILFDDHDALPTSAREDFEAVHAAYASQAFRTAAAGFRALAGARVPEPDRDWLGVLATISSALAAFAIDLDPRASRELVAEAQRAARAAPDEGLDLDVSAFRTALDRAATKLAVAAPTEAPLAKGLWPALVFRTPPKRGA